MNTIKKYISLYYDYFIIAIVYLTLHLFMHTNVWDDVSTTTVLADYNLNLFKYIDWVYHSWSSRIVIQAVWAVIGFLPNYIWKLIDTAMILILYHYMSKLVSLLLSNYSENKESRTWQMLFFLCFPYSLFGTAGWMTTTIVYTWTFALYFYSIYILLACPHKEKLSLTTYILFGIALLFSANFNVTAFSLLITFIFIFFTTKKNNAFNILFIEGMVIIIVNIALFLFAPGNKNRMAFDAIYHNTSDLLDMSLGGQIRMGINSTFYHFISVPNITLFIACLVLLIGVCMKTKSKLYRSVSLLPLVLDIFWTGYIFFVYTIPNRFLTYIYPDGSFHVCPKAEQYLALFSAIIMIFLILYLMAYLTGFTILSWSMICIVLTFGLLPLVALGFTTTVSASIIRMSAFFYFALIICVNIVVLHCNLIKNKLVKITLYLLGTLGVILNILQVVRHIMIYG